MVRPKKILGQHFLKDEGIARKIVASLSKKGYTRVLEIGPGTGALTGCLLEDSSIDLSVVEVDRESVEFLKRTFPSLKGKIYEEDFLKMDLDSFFFEGSGAGVNAKVTDGFPEKGNQGRGVCIIGNFPYNISSMILFRVYENRDCIPELVGMFQMEVAKRVCSQPGNRDYGILSVFLQAFFNLEYLFTVDEDVFNPPPKVKSAVIRMTRNGVATLGCDEVLFRKVVKTAFNQRRKTLRNALKIMLKSPARDFELLNKRAEQLSVKDFVGLTLWIGGQEEKPSSV